MKRPTELQSKSFEEKRKSHPLHTQRKICPNLPQINLEEEFGFHHLHTGNVSNSLAAICRDGGQKMPFLAENCGFWVGIRQKKDKYFVRNLGIGM